MEAAFETTPVRFCLDADEAEILAAVEHWVELLAREDYAAAYAFTEHDIYHEWTPELMRDVVYGYGFPIEPGEEIYKVTPIATARFRADGFAEHRNRVLTRDEEPWPYPHREKPGAEVVGEIWYDLPLNGL